MTSLHLTTRLLRIILLFFFNDTATTEIYTLSLHDALPISVDIRGRRHLPLLQIPGKNLSGQNQPQFLLGRRKLRNRTIASQIGDSQPITLSYIFRQRQKVHIALLLVLIAAQYIGTPASGIDAITHLQLHRVEIRSEESPVGKERRYRWAA